MKILGINACLSFNFDGTIRTVDGGGACLLEDGEITIGVSEERITKKKYDGGFEESIRYILSAKQYKMSDIDKIVCSFYGVPYDIPEILREELLKRLSIDVPEKLIIMPSHHLSHAYAAYFLSGFSESLIIVNDNEGQIIEGDMFSPLRETSCERNSYYLARNNSISLIHRDFDFPNSIGFGKMYNKFTRFLGFESYHNAGKTMGLAPFAEGNFSDKKDLYYFDINDKLHSIIEDTGDYVKDVQNMLMRVGFSHILPKKSSSPMTQDYAEIAGYVQYQLEKWQIKVLNKLQEKYKFENVCVSGGVALNCPTNTKISELAYVNKVFVPSAPHDQGQCIGNVIYGHLKMANKSESDDRVLFKENLYLGKKYTVNLEKVLDFLSKSKHFRMVDLKRGNRSKTIAKLLSEGKIVALFQGGSEFGPRALGNRSILANPKDSFIKDRININIKQRESFRPFAPSVLEERVEQYFHFKNQTSPSMMFTAKVKESYKNLLPAITHVDGTSRLQTVSKTSNPQYYSIIEEFMELTGIGMVLNTSFNLNGMPIVETPEDAFKCFESSTLDALVLEDFLILRR